MHIHSPNLRNFGFLARLYAHSGHSVFGLALILRINEPYLKEPIGMRYKLQISWTSRLINVLGRCRRPSLVADAWRERSPNTTVL